MYSDARALQEVGIEDTVPMLREALDQAGLEFDEIDYFIPHQTSARAIKKGDAGVLRESWVTRRSMWS